jgi:hypothetical protein
MLTTTAIESEHETAPHRMARQNVTYAIPLQHNININFMGDLFPTYFNHLVLYM